MRQSAGDIDRSGARTAALVSPYWPSDRKTQKEREREREREREGGGEKERERGGGGEKEREYTPDFNSHKQR